MVLIGIESVSTGGVKSLLLKLQCTDNTIHFNISGRHRGVKTINRNDARRAFIPQATEISLVNNLIIVAGLLPA